MSRNRRRLGSVFCCPVHLEGERMQSSRAKSLLARTATVVGLVALFVGAPVAASALNVGIGSYNDSYNQTLYYSTSRYHAGGSGSSFRLDSHTGFCGSSFRIALRNPVGDSTYFSHFTSLGSTKNFTWWNGSLNVPANWYKVTARNDCAGGGPTFSWQGLLHLN